MAMNRVTLEELRVLMDRVDALCSDVLVELDMQREWDGMSKRATPLDRKPYDYLMSGSRTTGSLRRASMDLTNALADMRKPS